MSSPTSSTENANGSQQSGTAQSIVQIIQFYRDEDTKAYVYETSPPALLDWTTLEHEFRSGSRELGMSRSDALDIRLFLISEIPKPERDKVALTALIQHFETYVQEHWDDFQNELCTQAIELICRHEPEIERFNKLLESWPLLKNNPVLTAELIKDFHAQTADRATRLRALARLEGRPDALRAILVTTLATARDHRGKNDQLGCFADLASKWAPASPWTQLVSWIVCDEPQSGSGVFLNHATTLQRVWEQLSYISFQPWGPRATTSLGKLSPQTESAWRRQLQRLIGDDLALKNAVTELLLWFGEVADDHSIIFALAQVWGSQLSEALSEFHLHPASLVRLRAETLQGLVSEVPDASQLLLAAQAQRLGVSPPVANAQARTWIADLAIEQLIEREFEACARTFGSIVPDVADSGEENLVATLFARLASAFENINTSLHLLASQRNDHEYLQFTLKYRLVGKPEEGGDGIKGAARFSTDICLIFTAEERQSVFTQRASLIQAKRLFGGEPVSKPEIYNIDQSQLEDLVKQTLESYLLLVGPVEAAPIPVIPAQLYLDLIRRGATRTTIRPEMASTIGRGLASWLLYEVIGLWAGDPDPDVVDKALGGLGRGPFMLANLTATRVPLRP